MPSVNPSKGSVVVVTRAQSLREFANSAKNFHLAALRQLFFVLPSLDPLKHGLVPLFSPTTVCCLPHSNDQCSLLRNPLMNPPLDIRQYRFLINVVKLIVEAALIEL